LDISTSTVKKYNALKLTSCPAEEWPSSENVPLAPPQPHVKILPPVYIPGWSFQNRAKKTKKSIGEAKISTSHQ